MRVLEEGNSTNVHDDLRKAGARTVYLTGHEPGGGDRLNYREKLIVLRLSLTVWGTKRKSLRVLLTGSSNVQGIPKYRCEISSQSNENKDGQDNEAKSFDLGLEITLKIQELLGDINITAAPQSVERTSEGINHLLKIEDGFHSATYVWGNQLPKGWEQLQELADLLAGVEESNAE